MKTVKIVLSLVLAFTFGIANLQAEEISIKDMDKSSGFAKEAIAALAEKNIITGDQNGNFNPKKSISRTELVALLVKTLELDTTNIPEEATFKDVPKNHWANKYVEAAYREGIITGKSTTEFGVNEATSREQIAVIFIRALKLVDQSDVIEIKNINSLKDKNKIADWAEKEVDIALASGLMTGVGNNSFEPKTNAPKEQAAVVLNRFIKDEKTIIEKINTEYGVNKEVKLTLNGDVISPKFYSVDENGNIFVSKQFIDKNIQLSDDAASRFTENKELFIETSTTYGVKDINTLWFKVGSVNAYKNAAANPNYSGDTPYAIEDKLQDNLITLETAPIEKDGTIYVPLKDIAKILEIEYSADAARNRVNLTNSLAPKFPNFNNAVKNGVYEKYVGNIDMLMEMLITDSSTNDSMKTTVGSKSIINKDAMYIQNTMSLEIAGETPTEIETKDIITKDKVYSLDVDNKWIEYDRKAWEDEIGGDISTGNEARLNEGFIKNYNNFSIKKIGTVKINGISTDKYIMNVSIDDLKYFMAEDQYNQIKELLSMVNSNTKGYEVEFYVADHQIIRQVVKFNGQISDETTSEKVEFKLTLDVAFSNIGNEGVIELPKAADIKQPE